MKKTKAANSQAGKNAAKRKIEIETSKRLAAKASAEAKRTIDLVRTGPNAAETSQPQGNERDRQSVGTTSSGKVNLLDNVLIRQSQGQQRAQLSGQVQSELDVSAIPTVSHAASMAHDVTRGKESLRSGNTTAIGLSKAKAPKGYVKYDIAQGLTDLQDALVTLTTTIKSNQATYANDKKVNLFVLCHIVAKKKVL